MTAGKASNILSSKRIDCWIEFCKATTDDERHHFLERIGQIELLLHITTAFNRDELWQWEDEIDDA